jgi:hypothetical protein
LKHKSGTDAGTRKNLNCVWENPTRSSWSNVEPDSNTTVVKSMLFQEHSRAMNWMDDGIQRRLPEKQPSPICETEKMVPWATKTRGQNSSSKRICDDPIPIRLAFSIFKSKVTEQTSNRGKHSDLQFKIIFIFHW